jgi:hypothetical protein
MRPIHSTHSACWLPVVKTKRVGLPRIFLWGITRPATERLSVQLLPQL